MTVHTQAFNLVDDSGGGIVIIDGACLTPDSRERPRSAHILGCGNFVFFTMGCHPWCITVSL